MFFIILIPDIAGQQTSGSSLKTTAGIAINEGSREIGVGGVVQISYQKVFYKNRLRIGPGIMAGSFLPFGITDQRDQYYRVTSIGLNCSYDLIKYKPLALFIEAGGNINYSRGLLGTGGMDQTTNNSEYFYKAYYGAMVAAGLRITPRNSRVTYEISPFNICFGNDYFMMSSFKAGVDISLGKKRE